MTSDRPYQRALEPEDALAELRRCAGTQFDPAVVDAFCRVSALQTADAAE
jgi:HD-GYP domain-containing protein (c-di-GMP phosphodiesterase class II)